MNRHVMRRLKTAKLERRRRRHHRSPRDFRRGWPALKAAIIQTWREIHGDTPVPLRRFRNVFAEGARP